MNAETIVGTSAQRVDVKDKATGQALYAADIQLPGMLYGKVVRCWEHAHARVVRLDLSQAAKSPGVVKVLGPADVTRNKYNSSVMDLMVSAQLHDMLGDIDDQDIFTTHVKYQGDAICGIIAKSEEAAERAAAKVIVEYEPLPVYLTAEASKQPDAVQFTPQKPGNRAFQLPEAMFPGNALGGGDVDAAMQDADIVVEDVFYVPKQKQCQMEPHAYIAKLDNAGRLTCWTSSQMPKLVQAKLAKLFELPMSRVKINATVIGGGFGARLGMISEPQACAMAMAVPGHPVKLQTLREEDWAISPSRHPGKYWMKIGLRKDGTPLACDARFENYKGAYYLDASGTAFTAGAWLGGMYKFPALRYKGESYFTNQGLTGAFRGYGNPQTNFALEQLIDRACAQVGADPVEWRKKWHKGVGDDGWCPGVTYPSCALDECLDRGAAAIDWAAKRRKYANQTGTKRRGVGCAVMNHTSGAMPMLLEHTVCTVKINEDATAEVVFACSDMGQGSHTALKQIAAETLGFPFGDVQLANPGSDAGFDIGAHASRTIYVGGAAVKAACEDAKRQLFARASEALQVPADQLDIRDKKIFAKSDPARSIDVESITRAGVYHFIDPMTGKPEGAPGQIQGYVSFFAPHNSPPFGASFAEVEVDTETGEVRVLELVNAHDIGRAINPAAVEGQLEGGIQQGLGFVLSEETYYDSQGRMLNNSFTDYKMFGPSDMPKIKTILVENADPVGPFGAKSVGESGLVSPVGAVANAIYHALGIQFMEAPITPEKVLKGINEKGLGGARERARAC
ncbi:xanthine dehydrogenase family protein molybdopterin-binding subunit [Aromatoleum buckelii]|uniref:Molybdopterin-dependent oxidoreductase n=1 Tax=Aromatoleum buckelii TaxID=200254 RepID=A0ABX1N6P4_9RHOO|nr:molybdopterin cofactor-binding domain-containing protein [Aromatoleum buckelii]MCK0511633.1 molybdopterin-dependent oxidoreductase [Aromatoleum buckelii]